MFAASKTASVSGGYQIQRSLRFNSADSAYLNRTPASATNRKTWTWSGWVKRSTLIASGGTPQNIFGARDGNYTLLRFNYFADPGNTIRLEDSGFSMITLPVYRDVSAWYHIVLAVDTTQATNTNRVKLYVNNVLQTFDGTYTSYPTQNYDTQVNNNIAHNIGAQPTYGDYFNGYMTEVNFIDGTQLTPSSFGETNAQTGVWQPKAYSGSYGTNGFYLNFSDNSNTTAATLGKDYSGNGNNWTPNNFSVTAGSGNDSLVDSPTSYGTDTGVGGTVRGNYNTWNPLQTLGGTGGTVSNGNLDFSIGTSQNNVASTLFVTTGKWYCEITATTISGTSIGEITINDSNGNIAVGYRSTGTKDVDSYSTNAAYGATWAVGDTIGVAFDVDNKQVTFYKNGTSQGAITYTGSALTTNSMGVLCAWRTSATFAGTANFGQRPFAYTAPSGYKALCTQNLPTPTIGATTATQAGKFFNPVLWTGDGNAPRNITGVGFQPDLVWIKQRSGTNWNILNDAVRGVPKNLYSNTTNAEDTTNYVSSLDADGFTLASTSSAVNLATSTYVAWNWKANGSGSTNTAGSITSTVSANTTSGFSVVTYTGTGSLATVGHGLGATPKMFIVKRRDTTSNWLVYNSVIGATNYLYLNTTDASAAWSGFWGNTAPTSTVFTVNNDGAVNSSGNTFVAYCFAEVAGYSKFGSYTGNGSTDGPFVFTGMRPAFLLVKCSSTAGENWAIYDATRDTYNVVYRELYPNSSAAETSGLTRDPPLSFDFLSNGFKLRGTNPQVNGNGNTYIFMALASNPFKYSLAR